MSPVASPSVGRPSSGVIVTTPTLSRPSAGGRRTVRCTRRLASACSAQRVRRRSARSPVHRAPTAVLVRLTAVSGPGCGRSSHSLRPRNRHGGRCHRHVPQPSWPVLRCGKSIAGRVSEQDADDGNRREDDRDVRRVATKERPEPGRPAAGPPRRVSLHREGWSGSLAVDTQTLPPGSGAAGERPRRAAARGRRDRVRRACSAAPARDRRPRSIRRSAARRSPATSSSPSSGGASFPMSIVRSSRPTWITSGSLLGLARQHVDLASFGDLNRARVEEDRRLRRVLLEVQADLVDDRHRLAPVEAATSLDQIDERGRARRKRRQHHGRRRVRAYRKIGNRRGPGVRGWRHRLCDVVGRSTSSCGQSPETSRQLQPTCESGNGRRRFETDDGVRSRRSTTRWVSRQVPVTQAPGPGRRQCPGL